jgi:hypothetical protein
MGLLAVLVVVIAGIAIQMLEPQLLEPQVKEVVVVRVVGNITLAVEVVQAVLVLILQINQMVVLENFLQFLVLIYTGEAEAEALRTPLAVVVTAVLVVEVVEQ